MKGKSGNEVRYFAANSSHLFVQDSQGKLSYTNLERFIANDKKVKMWYGLLDKKKHPIILSPGSLSACRDCFVGFLERTIYLIFPYGDTDYDICQYTTEHELHFTVGSGHHVSFLSVLPPQDTAADSSSSEEEEGSEDVDSEEGEDSKPAAS